MIGRIVETIAVESQRFYFVSGSVSPKLSKPTLLPIFGMFLTQKFNSPGQNKNQPTALALN